MAQQQQPQRSNQTGSKTSQQGTGKTDQRNASQGQDERFNKASQNQSEKGKMTDQSERGSARNTDLDEE